MRPDLVHLGKTLWLILFSAFVEAQSTSGSALPTQTVSLASIPTLVSLPPLNITRPSLQLSITPSTDLHLTFNLCSLTANTSLLPTILISTEATPSWELGGGSLADAGSGGIRAAGYNRRSRQGGIWSITWDKGFGNWTNLGGDVVGAVQVLMHLGDGSTGSQIIATGNMVVQLGISAQGPLHRLSTRSPLLGDTTANTALIFSHILHHEPHHQPTYPNYTLPGAQLSFQSPSNVSTSRSNLTLIMVPTGSSPTNDGLDNSICAIRAANASTGGIASPRNMILNRTDLQWMAVGGEEGYRTSWGIGDLVTGGSNYTAWTLDETNGELSKPIWLVTKDAGFACPIIRPNDFCPSIAYAAPLPPDPANPFLPLATLPSNISDYLTTHLQAFSTSLLSSACGRDRYSFASSCADCYAAYRDWLCRIVIPRCTGNNTADLPISPQIMYRSTTEPRLVNVPLQIPSGGYTELLPCLSTCNAVDRACPVNLNFRCPLRKHGASKSYAFIGDQPNKGDGARDTGSPAADRWGNVWCNG